MIDWSNNLSLELIDEYKKWPILWNSNHPRHYSREQKLKAWDAIATHLGVSVAEAKQKMNSLLGSLRREKSKGKKTTGTDKGPVYVSKWFAFKRMQFLLNRSELESTLDLEMAHHKYRNSEIIEVEIQDNPEKDSKEKVIVAKRRTFVPRVATPKHKRRESTKNDSNLDEKLKNLNHSLLARPEDACSTYGAHVANKIRNYSQQVRVQVEHAINNILYDADMGRYDIPPPELSPTMSDASTINDFE